MKTIIGLILISFCLSSLIASFQEEDDMPTVLMRGWIVLLALSVGIYCLL